MNTKILKIPMCLLVLLLLLSVVFPTGAVMNDSYKMAHLENNNYDNPIEYIQPTTTYIVEVDNGESIEVEIPIDLDQESIEQLIEKELNEYPFDDEELQDEITMPEISSDSNETHIVLHNSAWYGGFDGYLFCKMNAILYFNVSNLLWNYPVLKYEWDFNGDWVYETESTSSEISYIFMEIGLYNMHVRVTYNYSYIYYPYYSYYDYDGIVPLSQGISWDQNYISEPLTVSVLNILEYQIQVSVGSDELGYPPILDFEFQTRNEVEESIDDNSAKKRAPVTFEQPWDSYIAIFEPPSYIIHPGLILPIISNTSQNSKQSIIYVKMKGVNNIEKIIQLSDCVVDFDASNTKDLNGDSKFFWDFGDEQFGQGIHESHTYKKKGTYTATLYIDGWNSSISKTFSILRGAEDPKLGLLTSGYEADRYMIANINNPFVFDISIMSSFNFEWCEWDFDGDGLYEINVTSKTYTHTFLKPGYFQASCRYTYSTKSTPFRYNYNQNAQYQIPVSNYWKNTLWFTVVVANKDGIFPPIPDFTTEAPSSFSWWNQNLDLQDSNDKIKNVTNIFASYSNISTLNSWNSNVNFNANCTINLNLPYNNDLTYTWDFGDGSTGSGEKVTHSYMNTNKDYPVKLTVSNGVFDVTICKMVRPRPYSPNIYLYRESPGYDSIKVIVDGTVTKAVPFVELGSDIFWEDVWLMDGKMFYNGKSYDYLYYEELLDKPKNSEYGWILERDEEGRLYLNDELMSLDELKEFFRGELKIAGLYKNEIEDFIDEWLGEGARLFPAQKTFRYAIMYISEDVINEVIRIETEKDYDEMIRVHFVIQPVDEDFSLIPPQYPEHKRGVNILHEWGIYSLDAEDEEQQSDNGNSWQNPIFNGLTEYRIKKDSEIDIIGPNLEWVALDAPVILKSTSTI